MLLLKCLGWIPNDHNAIWNVSYNDSTSTDYSANADTKLLYHGGIAADQASFSQMCVPTNRCPRKDCYIVFNLAIVTDYCPV